jgi:hypothetical protein
MQHPPAESEPSRGADITKESIELSFIMQSGWEKTRLNGLLVSDLCLRILERDAEYGVLIGRNDTE